MNHMIYKIAALVAGCFVAGSASATTNVNQSYNLGLSTPTSPYINLGSYAPDMFYVGGVNVTGTNGDPFNHEFTFNISSALSAGSSIVDTPLTIGMSLVLKNIGSFSASIDKWNGSSWSSYPPPYTPTSSDLLQLNQTFSVGQYKLNVSGTLNGSAGGIYTITAITSAVPEPETWAMLVAGLGLIGLRLRQKATGSRQVAIN